LLAAILWTVEVAVRPGDFSAAGLLLLGFGLLTMAAVAVVGMVVTGGRWSHVYALITLGLTAVVAITRPVTTLWLIALLVSAAAAIALLGETVRSGVRKLPSAAGPGSKAVVLPLLLLAVPVGLALGSPSPGWLTAASGIAASLTAFLYSRVIVGGLLATRVLWPLLSVASAFPLVIPDSLAPIASALAVAAIAWQPEIKAAYHPPVETGSTFPIPPELAPPDILGAAGQGEAAD
jgi:hypothetical protein